MAERREASAGAAGRNHSAALDHTPELWAEILRRVPQTDRQVNMPLHVSYKTRTLKIRLTATTPPPPNTRVV